LIAWFYFLSKIAFSKFVAEHSQKNTSGDPEVHDGGQQNRSVERGCPTSNVGD